MESKPRPPPLMLLHSNNPSIETVSPIFQFTTLHDMPQSGSFTGKEFFDNLLTRRQPEIYNPPLCSPWLSFVVSPRARLVASDVPQEAYSPRRFHIHTPVELQQFRQGQDQTYMRSVAYAEAESPHARVSIPTPESSPEKKPAVEVQTTPASLHRYHTAPSHCASSPPHTHCNTQSPLRLYHKRSHPQSSSRSHLYDPALPATPSNHCSPISCPPSPRELVPVPTVETTAVCSTEPVASAKEPITKLKPTKSSLTRRPRLYSTSHVKFRLRSKKAAVAKKPKEGCSCQESWKVRMQPLYLELKEKNYKAIVKSNSSIVCSLCNKKCCSTTSCDKHALKMHTSHTFDDEPWVIQGELIDEALDKQNFSSIAKSPLEHACSLCNEEFKTPLACKRHAIKEHTDLRYKCDMCSTTYTRPDALRRHLQQVR